MIVYMSNFTNVKNKVNYLCNIQRQTIGDINNDGNIDIKKMNIGNILAYSSNTNIGMICNIDINNNNISNFRNLSVNGNLNVKNKFIISNTEILLCKDNIIVLNKPTHIQGNNVDSGIGISYIGTRNPGLIYKKIPQSNILNGKINRFVLGNIDVSGSNIDANGNPYGGNAIITDLSTLHINNLEGDINGNLIISKETPNTILRGHTYVNKNLYINNSLLTFPSTTYSADFIYKLWEKNTPVANVIASNISANLRVERNHVRLLISNISGVNVNRVVSRFYLTTDIDKGNDEIPIIYRPNYIYGKTMFSRFQYLIDNTGGTMLQLQYPITFGNVNLYGNAIAFTSDNLTNVTSNYPANGNINLFGFCLSWNI